jgi:hypothetical protein
MVFFGVIDETAAEYGGGGASEVLPTTFADLLLRWEEDDLGAL